MGQLILRQLAIDALAENMPQAYTPDGSHPADEGIFMAQEIYADCIQTLKELPSAQPNITHIIMETLAECGIYGEEATIKLIGTLKRIGRDDLLPPCAR